MKNLTSEQLDQISDAVGYVWLDGGCVESLRDMTMRAAIDADRALNGWQPIETAPISTAILVTNGEIVMAGEITNFANKLWFDACGVDGYEYEFKIDMTNASHWMPLPPLPKDSK